MCRNCSFTPVLPPFILAQPSQTTEVDSYPWTKGNTVMRLGVLLPHRAVVLQSARRPPLEVCWTVARMCDEAGLDLWVGDSVVAKPRLEPLTTLAYLAALTQRARLGTAVLLPALRDPPVLAHALANIDQLQLPDRHGLLSAAI